MGSRTNASKLFDLFRDREDFAVLDRDGHEVAVVTLQALDWQQNQALVKTMESARLRVRIEMEKNEERQRIEESVVQLTEAQLVEIIVSVERPLASSVADLAPNGLSEESQEAKKKEEEAIKRWEESRTKELGSLSLAELRDIVVRRQESLLVQARAVQDYINESLCLMVIDPETGDSLFSLEETSADYIGRIMPELRTQLLKFREEFLAKRAEKPVRKAAEDPAFLASGESPKSDTDSPGATTETPRRSPRSRSVSTTVATG